jgi:hypothetical protein
LFTRIFRPPSQCGACPHPGRGNSTKSRVNLGFWKSSLALIHSPSVGVVMIAPVRTALRSGGSRAQVRTHPACQLAKPTRRQNYADLCAGGQALGHVPTKLGFLTVSTSGRAARGAGAWCGTGICPDGYIPEAAKRLSTKGYDVFTQMVSDGERRIDRKRRPYEKVKLLAESS